MTSLAWSVLMLLVVVAAIPATLWLVKRLQNLHPAGAPRAIEVLTQLSVGPRERVTAVRVGQRVLVLGVTAHQVTLLAELQGGTSELPPAGTSVDFPSMLRTLSGRARPAGKP
jgi:flagellar protein FliO/FliZ